MSLVNDQHIEEAGMTRAAMRSRRQTGQRNVLIAVEDTFRSPQTTIIDRQP